MPEKKVTREEMAEAVKRLEGHADRWEHTPEWHNPPFLIGEIHIDTGDLRAIHTLVRGLQAKGMDELLVTLETWSDHKLADVAGDIQMESGEARCMRDRFDMLVVITDWVKGMNLDPQEWLEKIEGSY